ncbi:MAG: tRNA-binding protein [Synergistaceae bacterium]|nr:tRNA-binding protein [Synergistaceae bacterium]
MQQRASNSINIEDFDKVEVRAGTVVDVKENKKSRNPAYVLTIDFGEEIGTKKSSAQITALYKPEDLLGTQVICCVNLEPLHIGSVKSEVRVLGTDSDQGVVLLRPTEPVRNGDRVF